MLERDAYELLKDKIIRGVYPPGTVLSEIETSNDLGMSRTPVRAALSRLYCEGLVTQRKGHFSTVRSVTPKDVRNFFEYCLIVEEYAVRRIYDDFEAFDLEKVKDAIEQQRDAALRVDVDGYYNADHAYHMTFINFLDNEEVTKSIENMWDKINMVAHSNPNSRIRISNMESVKEHEKIYGLLEERTPVEELLTAVREANISARNRLLLD